MALNSFTIFTMSIQTLKYCRKCQKDTYQEWQVDNEIADEPTFWLICTECLNEDQQIEL